MRGTSTALACLFALAGCDVVLRLDTIEVASAGPSTLVAGDGFTCWIRPNRTLWCWGRNDGGQVGIGNSSFELTIPTQIGGAKWQAVSAAGYHTCGIQADRSLWCWGDNEFGQLGTGDLTSIPTPNQVPGTWTQVSAGTHHTCAIDHAGALWCWGDNENGEIGAGTIGGNVVTPTLIGSGFTQVAANDYFTCAIRRDASLWCWGHDGDAQLGNSNFTDVGAPTPATSSEHWVELAAAAASACGLTVEGKLRCWGANYAGESGGTGLGDLEAPSPVLVGGVDRNDWVAVAANGRHACAWNKAHEVWCLGDSSHGELGLDGITFNPTPFQIPGAWAAFALGAHHACGLDASNVVSCAGANGWGQLGNGSDTVQLAPVAIGSPKWLRVRAAGGGTCVEDDANVQSWSCTGANASGQLGLGTRTSQQTLQPLPGPWASVHPGDTHSCGIDVDGNLKCWGDNDQGKLGVGSTSSLSTTPVQVAVTGTQQVAVSDHTCAIDIGGTLRCWGPNSFGQSDPATEPSAVTSPGAAFVAPAETSSTWESVGAGASGYTCAVHTTTTGTTTVWCIGHNAEGELGNNSTTDHTAAMAEVLTASGQPFTVGSGGPNAGPPQVLTAVTHACAIDATTTSCWGELYDANHVTPMKVTTPLPFAAIAVGQYHTCGIRQDGTLACWGENSRGQLGTNDATRAGSTTPINVTIDINGSLDLKGWQAVAAGDFHTCALHGNTTPYQLYCWGSDDDGALGDGNAWTTTLTPVMAPLL